MPSAFPKNAERAPHRQAAGGLAAVLMLLALAQPQQSGAPEYLAILLIAAVLLDSLSRQRFANHPGTGFPALALASGLPGLGAPWLLSAWLFFRALLATGLRVFPKADFLTWALSFLVATVTAKFVPLKAPAMVAAVTYLLACLALDGGREPVNVARKALQELLWFGLVVWCSLYGIWPLLGALVALLFYYGSAPLNQEELEQSLSQQMRSTEHTLKTTEERYRKDKSRIQNLMSLQQLLDEFQGKALKDGTLQCLAQSLMDTCRRLDPDCGAAFCRWEQGRPAVLMQTGDFQLTDFEPFPKDWLRGKTVRSACAKRCFHPLDQSHLFLFQYGRAEQTPEQEAFLEHLLARAGLIDRIIEQQGELSSLLDEKTEALEQLALSQAQLLQSEKMAAVGQLAAGVAHEINSPLAAIQLQARMAKRRLAKGDQDGVESSIETCEKAAARAQSIIEGLLSYSRPSDGSRARVKLKDVVAQTTSMLEAHFEEALVALEVSVDGEAEVIGNAQELSQILTNVLLNAVDALKARESDRKIVVRSDTNQSDIELSVFNNGPLLEQETSERLFEPFYTTKEVGSGTGLGLSVAYQLAQAHGGRLEGANSDGGVRFSLILPKVS